MEVHAGSCEPCKKKKCKCDRQRPHCGQCASLTSLCKYNENNKRGLPGGYLSTLEQRLFDTEAALYDVITDLHKIQENPSRHSASRPARLNSARSSKITKTSRLAEWAKYPLKRPEDIERWWIGVGEKGEDNVVPDGPVSFSSHPETPLPGETSEEQQRMTFHHEESHSQSEKGNSYRGFPSAHQQSDNSMQGIPHLIEPTYPRNLTASSENEAQRNMQRHFPYNDEISADSLGRSAVDHNDHGALVPNVGASSQQAQLDDMQNQAQDWHSTPGSDSNTQNAHLEFEENLPLSKQLLNTKPNIYY